MIFAWCSMGMHKCQHQFRRRLQSQYGNQDCRCSVHNCIPCHHHYCHTYKLQPVPCRGWGAASVFFFFLKNRQRGHFIPYPPDLSIPHICVRLSEKFQCPPRLDCHPGTMTVIEEFKVVFDYLVLDILYPCSQEAKRD